MSMIGARVGQLEKRMQAGIRPRRVYRVIGGLPEDDGAGFLRGLGYQVGADVLIIRRMVYRPGIEGPVCVGGELRLAGAA